MALCHLSADINLANYLADQSPYVHAMDSGPAMRLRTQIELLAALILTLAALVAISKMAKATGMNVEDASVFAATCASRRTGSELRRQSSTEGV